MSNYYDILGIDKESSNDQIKKAFRKLSYENHPDRNNGNKQKEQLYKDITNAYETLKDSAKRREYDLTLNLNNFSKIPNAFNISPESIINMLFKPPQQNTKNKNINVSDILGINSDTADLPFQGIHIIGNMDFGINGNESPFDLNNFNGFNSVNNLNKSREQVKPLTLNLSIDINDAFTGITKPIEIKRKIIDGQFTCEENETLYVDIMQGIDDGELIEIKDKGNIINNVKGDVKIFIKIKNETLFKRDGLNLSYSKDISLKDALCGFKFELEYIDGNNYTINNKQGNIIKNNHTKIIPKLGFKRNNDVGNLHIKFNIIFPETLNNNKIEELKNIL